MTVDELGERCDQLMLAVRDLENAIDAKGWRVTAAVNFQESEVRLAWARHSSGWAFYVEREDGAEPLTNASIETRVDASALFPQLILAIEGAYLDQIRRVHEAITRVNATIESLENR